MDLLIPMQTGTGDVSQLVRQAQEGDAPAFSRLVASFEQMVFSVAHRHLDHPEDAQDVVQETFLEAFRGLSRLREPAAFPGWIRRIAQNLALQRLRRRAAGMEIPAGDGGESLFDDPSEEAPIPRGYDCHEFPGLMLRAISRVPEMYQLPLMLRFLERLSPQEIGEELWMNGNTVRVDLHRGTALLRQALQDVLRERENRPSVRAAS